ncbi:MAG: endolytic transglycosylase MltG [Eubacteriales bacterium]
MENNSNRAPDGSNTDDILDILNRYRASQSSDGQEQPAPEPAVPEPEPSAEFEGISGHFSDTADLSKIRKERDSHFKSTGEKKKKPLLKRFFAALGNMSFLLKAVLYLAVVLAVSVYCIYYAVTGMNDVFALVNSDAQATITVTADTTLGEIADSLAEQGVIRYPWLFNLYCKYYSDDEIALIEGEYTFSDSQNYSNILYSVTHENIVRTTVRVTIPEGYTVDNIIDLLVEKNVGTREGFVDAINNYPYKHEFVKLLDEMGYSSDRKYRLEGYLYPDTYEFYTDSAEYLVINKILNNFSARFWDYYDEDYRSDIESLGMTFDDIVTLASMIQAEAKYIIDYECVSYVFHNRLSHPNTFPYLQSDATVQYFLDEREQELTQEALDTDNPYNTYLYEGLPPGAICNPGLDALESAIYPSAPLNNSGKVIDAYYFVSDNAGNTYYSATLAGHEANKATVAKINAGLKDADD